MTIETSRSEIQDAYGSIDEAWQLPVAGLGFSHHALVRAASTGEGSGS